MYEINRIRVIAGVIAGEAALVLGYAVLSGPAFLAVIIVGSVLALLSAIIFLWPAYVLLRDGGQLKIWWVLLVGALTITFPGLVVSFFSAVSDNRGFTYFAEGALLIEDGRYTTEGWLQFFVLGPLREMPYGILAALIGWVVAFGFCREPPRLLLDPGGSKK